MATRTLLHSGSTANKCLFANVQYCRHLLQIPQKGSIRYMRKLNIPIKQSKLPININVDAGEIRPSKLWKQLGFAVTFSGASLLGAAILNYEYIEYKIGRILYYQKNSRINRTGWRREMQKWWTNLTEGQKIFVPILFLNTVVFFAWRVPAWQKIMCRYFTANPAARVSCWPMVLSTFSHYNIFHLGANMYVLHSFSTLAVSSLGKEHFMAVYLSGGVIANFASYLYRTVLKTSVVSLGASGAIMAILGYTCTELPNLPLHIIFLSMFSFTGSVAIKTLMALDTAGCLLRWKIFDHAAHLGGALFGIYWCHWGYEKIWDKREFFVAFWRQLREPRKP